MYEVNSKLREVSCETVQTFGREIFDDCILEVEAGTNGFHGGDSGHGGRTYLRIEDGAQTDIRAALLGHCGDQGFEVWLGGDAELRSFIKALKFAVKVLEDQVNGADD